MSVRVLTDYGSTVTHDDATHFKVGGADDDTLFLFALPDDWPIATYARGRWVSAQRVAAPEPEPPLLKPGTLVRIPGMDVPYVVDKGLATSGPHATLTFTTVDGRDWAEDRSEPVNAAAKPVVDPETARLVNESVAPLPPLLNADGTLLSETTEPYVSVNLSVTSDNSAEVLKVIKDALRNGSLTIPTKALT